MRIKIFLRIGAFPKILETMITILNKKWSFPKKYFFSKFDQIRSFLRIWSHLLKKSFAENFIFSAVKIIDCFRKFGKGENIVTNYHIHGNGVNIFKNHKIYETVKIFSWIPKFMETMKLFWQIPQFTKTVKLFRWIPKFMK